MAMSWDTDINSNGVRRVHPANLDWSTHLTPAALDASDWRNCNVLPPSGGGVNPTAAQYDNVTQNGLDAGSSGASGGAGVVSGGASGGAQTATPEPTADWRSPHMEATDLLAEALKQMDGLLGGASLWEATPVPHTPPPPAASPAPQQRPLTALLAELQLALGGSTGEMTTILDDLPRDKRDFLQTWLAHPAAPLSPSPLSTESADQLRSDKDHLALQVSVLADQVDAQSDTIRDLERSLGRGGRGGCGGGGQERRPADRTESPLQRGGATPDKLDLMAEVSSLKLKLATSECDRVELGEKMSVAQKRINDLQARLNDRTVEVTGLRSKVAQNGILPASLADSEANRERTLDRDRTLDRLKRKQTEVERLKRVVESLMITNEEKDNRIDEMQQLMTKYKRLEEKMMITQGQRGSERLGSGDETRNRNRTGSSSTSSIEITLRDCRQPLIHQDGVDAARSMIRQSSMPNPSATSTPVNSLTEGVVNGNHCASPPSTIANSYNPSPWRLNAARSSSCENVAPLRGLPPTGSTSKAAAPAPTFAETDEEALKDRMAQQYKAMQASNVGGPAAGAGGAGAGGAGTGAGTGAAAAGQRKRSKGGIRRLFGRLRRSNSQDLQQGSLEEFKRSGVRATATARLGWSKDMRVNELCLPFSQWDGERVAGWLHSLGLSMYVGDCKRWVRNGEQLLSASQHQLEAELGIKNHFHRKKLLLALQAVNCETRSPIDTVDYKAVSKWLDDIGLPQYKDQFTEARIDGRVLHYLTVDDLVSLKVTNALHHLSIKRGIQVLRMNDFNLSHLKRRPAPDEGPLSSCPDEVVLWTNHRVMEWLRSIDLSEYAPNLRGSGVHGALMVMEPQFSADVFASILSIAASRTLLRRHLSAHFVALIGSNMQQQKRVVEGQSRHPPLTPNRKIKVKKAGLFGPKRSRSEDHRQFLCPMAGDGGPALADRSVSTWGRDGALRREMSMPDRASTLPRNTGNMLSRDHFLDNVPTSNV